MTFLQESKRYQKLKFCYFSFKNIKTHLNKDGIEKKDLVEPPTTQIRDAITTDKPYIVEGHGCIGILTGKRSNITVIDCDTVESYNEKLEEYPEFKNYYTVKTNKGYHIYCKYTDKIKSSVNKLKDNVDIINDGYFIIAPPTTYKLIDKTIVSYKLIDKDGKIKEFPKYLITKYSQDSTTAKPTKKATKPKQDVIPIEQEIMPELMPQSPLYKYFQLLNHE